VVEVLHGHRIVDPYRWLEDAGDPRTVGWSAEQHRFFLAERDRWSQRAAISQLVEQAFSGASYSTPRCYRGRYFFTYLAEGREHPILVSEVGGVRSTLLDPIELDPSGGTVLQAWEPSWEGELIAVQLSAGGSEDATLQVLEVQTGAVVDGPIDRVRKSSIGWLPGGRQFYYVRRLPPELHPGEERYHRRVFVHTVGRPVTEDVLVFGDGRDKLDHYSLAVEPAGRWLRISATNGTAERRDVWIAEVGATPHLLSLIPVQVGVPARTHVHFAADSAAELLYLRTYADAPRGRIMVADASHPARDWRELIAEDPEAVLSDLVILDAAGLAQPIALVTRNRHAISEIAIFDLRDGRYLGLVPLPGVGAVGSLRIDHADPSRAWFSYTDSATRAAVLCYDAVSGVTAPWAVSSAPAGAHAVITRQAQFQSADGTTVRMFILSAAGHPDRPRPAILTGYGGFGAAMTPGYQPDAWAWVQAGGIFAIACLRGGGEEGAAWHRAGTRDGKQKVFEDFDAATDHLLREGWTSQDQLGIVGGSNGGLLVGAALTRHPQKYTAVVCLAPLLDMVRYEKFGMGPSWRDEYGSAADPAGLATLLGYSPYHAVRPGTAYPAVLLGVFDADTRVDPLHARKMCAALQAATAGRGPIVLRAESGVGHGLRARTAAVELLVDSVAFLADELGLGIPTVSCTE